jgi:hypothetical protein
MYTNSGHTAQNGGYLRQRLFPLTTLLSLLLLLSSAIPAFRGRLQPPQHFNTHVFGDDSPSSERHTPCQPGTAHSS